METLTAEQFKKKYGDKAVNSFVKPQQSMIQETGQDIGQIGSDISKSLSEGKRKMNEAMERGISGEQGALETTAQQIGAGFGTASSIFGDIFKGAVKAVLPQSWETGIKEGTTAVITPVLETQIAKSVIQKYNSLDERTKANIDAVLGTAGFALDVATLGGGKKAGEMGIKTAMDAVEESGKIIRRTGQEVIDAIPSVVKKGSLLVKPKPNAMEAAGQVIQGVTKNIKPGVRAIAQLDVSDVKTFKELFVKIKTRITELAKQVDYDLSQDTNRRLLKDLIIKTEANSGKVIKDNIVKKALDQLEELYTKIGDKVGMANIKEARSVANKEGLTNIEINDLARVYGQEFGEKAFNKMGDALTSINAQMYENTRKSLKDLARQGIKGKEAQLADKAMSDLYDFQRLVKKNIEAVNKLQNKIAKRGLLEKIGYNVTKYADILSGGTIRGIVGGVLPRGVGYKVMNAVDIEKVLNRNLKIIQDAIQSGNDVEIVKILNGLEVVK